MSNPNLSGALDTCESLTSVMSNHFNLLKKSCLEPLAPLLRISNVFNSSVGAHTLSFQSEARTRRFSSRPCLSWVPIQMHSTHSFSFIVSMGKFDRSSRWSTLTCDQNFFAKKAGGTGERRVKCIIIVSCITELRAAPSLPVCVC